MLIEQISATSITCDPWLLLNPWMWGKNVYSGFTDEKWWFSSSLCQRWPDGSFSASGQRSIEFDDSRENWPEGISSYCYGEQTSIESIYQYFHGFLLDFWMILPSQTAMIFPFFPWRLGGRAGDAQRCDSSVLGGSVRGISMICWDPLYMRAIYQYHGSRIFCWVG